MKSKHSTQHDKSKHKAKRRTAQSKAKHEAKEQNNSTTARHGEGLVLEKGGAVRLEGVRVEAVRVGAVWEGGGPVRGWPQKKSEAVQGGSSPGGGGPGGRGSGEGRPAQESGERSGLGWSRWRRFGRESTFRFFSPNLFFPVSDVFRGIAAVSARFFITQNVFTTQNFGVPWPSCEAPGRPPEAGEEPLYASPPSEGLLGVPEGGRIRLDREVFGPVSGMSGDHESSPIRKRKATI